MVVIYVSAKVRKNYEKTKLILCQFQNLKVEKHKMIM